MRLVYWVIGWTLGILISAASFANVSQSFILICCLIALMLAVGLRRSEYLIVAAFALGFWRFAAMPSHEALTVLNGTGFYAVEGWISAEPDQRDTRVQVRATIDSVRTAGQSHPLSGDILILAPVSFEGAYGDRIRAWGALETPGEGDRFSYTDYLTRNGISAVMRYADVTITQKATTPDIFTHLIMLKHQASVTIARALPEPYAGLLTGILLGDEQGIAPELREAFAQTGASHIIAISGFNMAILGSVISTLFKRLKATPFITVAASITLITVYTILVGASPSVMRAALMTSIVLIGSALRRKTFVPASLAFAAWVLTLLNPYTLWDVGFQLSFFAVLGLALFATPFTRFYDRIITNVPKPLSLINNTLREATAISVAALVFTLPLSALYFGRLSPAVLLINALIVPVQPAVMLIGGTGVLIGMFVPLIGQILLWGNLIFLAWTIEIVRLFARLPTAEVTISPNFIAFSFCIVLGIAIVTASRPPFVERLAQFARSKPVIFGALITAFLAITILIMDLRSRPDGLLHIWMLDIGSSTSLIQTPGGAHLLIDGGRYPTRLLTALGDRLPFTDQTLDVQIITQPDVRLISALPSVYERYTSASIILNGLLAGEDALEAIAEKVAPRAPIPALDGYQVQFGDGVRLTIEQSTAMAIDGDSSDAERDENALVMRLSYGEFSMLFTGNLNINGQARLNATDQLAPVTVLEVPRSGRRGSLAADFITRLRPQIAVVHLDRLNDAITPDPETLSMLANAVIYRSDVHGTIHLTSDGKQVWVAVDTVR